MARDKHGRFAKTRTNLRLEARIAELDDLYKLACEDRNKLIQFNNGLMRERDEWKAKAENPPHLVDLHDGFSIQITEDDGQPKVGVIHTFNNLELKAVMDCADQQLHKGMAKRIRLLIGEYQALRNKAQMAPTKSTLLTGVLGQDAAHLGTGDQIIRVVQLVADKNKEIDYLNARVEENKKNRNRDKTDIAYWKGAYEKQNEIAKEKLAMHKEFHKTHMESIGRKNHALTEQIAVLTQKMEDEATNTSTKIETLIADNRSMANTIDWYQQESLKYEQAIRIAHHVRIQDNQMIADNAREDVARIRRVHAMYTCALAIVFAIMLVWIYCNHG